MWKSRALRPLPVICMYLALSPKLCIDDTSSIGIFDWLAPTNTMIWNSWFGAPCSTDRLFVCTFS